MQIMKFEFKSYDEKFTPQSGILVLGALEDGELLNSAKAIDTSTFGHISKSIKVEGFKGKKDEVLKIVVPHSIQADVIIVVGLGKQEDITPKSLEESGAKVMACVAKTVYDTMTICLPDLPHGSDGLARFVSGIELRSWKFDIYKTVDVKGPKGPQACVVLSTSVDETQAAYNRLHAVNEGNALTRLVVSEPPNVLYPETMAIHAKTLERYGLKVEILGEKEMEILGMRALLGVGQGSIRESQLIVIQWNGAEASKAPIAFVGKGVTFDTGGISIKPSANMEDMKYDMGGSGAVLGLMKSLALRKANVNAVGVLGMVENMPSGSAQRPADIVKSMSGQTIEILNTDAEGRLVLADALWYTQDRFKPTTMIDLATLTGAITVALGYEYAGLFSNNDDLALKISAAGDKIGEPVWRFPMNKAYDRDIDSDVADVKNIGSGRGAGSITAAQFLQRFVNNVPWVHLDIAGMAWDKKDKPLTGKGATGFGVRLLDTMVEEYFEG